MSYVVAVTASYIKLRSIYVGDARKVLTPGETTVLVEGDPDFSVVGMLNPRGLLTGMAKLYAKLPLELGTDITFMVPSEGTIVIIAPKPAAVVEATIPRAETVFQAKGLRPIHLEVFRPENLDVWEPRTETDVYLAFGVLQDLTDYQYCCGASQEILTKLGYTATTKPDAILIERKSDLYLMAEWKMRSSAFKGNHQADDVDVLVCWDDDETDRTALPRQVLALHEIAKEAVGTKLGIA